MWRHTGRKTGVTKQNKKTLTHVGLEHGASQLKRNGGEVSGISNMTQQSRSWRGTIASRNCSDGEIEEKLTP